MTNFETVKNKLFSTAAPSEKMNDEIRNQVKQYREKGMAMLKQIAEEENPLTEEDYRKICELGDFMLQYVNDFGERRAVLDFQTGLNMLTGYKKNAIVQEQIQLDEDMIFGEKTFRTILYVIKKYPIDVIKSYIKLGAANNIIWDTKNNPDIDTDEAVEVVTEELNDERK